MRKATEAPHNVAMRDGVPVDIVGLREPCERLGQLARAQQGASPMRLCAPVDSLGAPTLRR